MKRKSQDKPLKPIVRKPSDQPSALLIHLDGAQFAEAYMNANYVLALSAIPNPYKVGTGVHHHFQQGINEVFAHKWAA